MSCVIQMSANNRCDQYIESNDNIGRTCPHLLWQSSKRLKRIPDQLMRSQSLVLFVSIRVIHPFDWLFSTQSIHRRVCIQLKYPFICCTNSIQFRNILNLGSHVICCPESKLFFNLSTILLQ